LEEYKDDEEREREEKKHHLYQLKQQLEQYLQELPVVGFNTGTGRTLSVLYTCRLSGTDYN
jgi:hypothetical protein